MARTPKTVVKPARKQTRRVAAPRQRAMPLDVVDETEEAAEEEENEEAEDGRRASTTTAPSSQGRYQFGRVELHRELRFRITGRSPLLMNNGLKSDPLHPNTRKLAAITGKKSKTEADHKEIAHLEFLFGLYLNQGRPCLTQDMLLAMLVKGAKKSKKGPQAEAGLLVEEPAFVEYDGPTDPEKLFADETFRLRCPVKVNMKKTQRTRPMFPNWAATFEVKYLPSLLDENDIAQALETAGVEVGVGDWRPRFGRFSADWA